MTAAISGAGVAAGHPATAAAGATILQQGGNAIDAAVAATWAACVAEPILTGPLGAGLMMVHPPDGDDACLDFFSRVPGLGLPPAVPEDFVAVDVSFGPTNQIFHIGRGAAAVPGTAAGLFEAHRRWGRLPMTEVVLPACRLGRAGVPLTERMAQMMRFLRPILVHTEGARALYAPDGELLDAGESFYNVALADTLEALARESLTLLTAGRLGDAVVEFLSPPAGRLTHEDLRAYAPSWRTPMVVEHRGADVVLPPPPTAGGPLVAHALRELGSLGTGSSAMDRRALLSDRATAMRRTNAARAEVLNTLGSTTHVSVIDEDGMAVAVTTSNGESCGWVIPGTGIAINNFLGEADINPDGFHRQGAGQQMLTMMCPTLVRKGDGHLVAMGTGGSNRIRSAILQVVSGLLDEGLELAAAIEAPRLHVEGSVLNIEAAGLGAGVVAQIGSTYDEVITFDEPNMFFGGVHAVCRDGLSVTGAGDPRRGGVFVSVEPPH